MKKTALFKLALAFIGGPLAGAFGIWLLTEAPQIHGAVCNPMGL